MIKNERQYRITRAQAEKFQQALARLGSETTVGGLDPILRKAELEALESQLGDLRAEMGDYEALKSGGRQVFELRSLEDLPRVLIEARIGSGLSQRKLAEKLGIKEQQIQRYEATDYKSASLGRVAEVAEVVGIKAREDILLPKANFSMATFLRRLKEVGLEKEFVLRRLLPEPPGILLGKRLEGKRHHQVVLEAAESVQRVFGWTPAAIFGAGPLAVEPSARAHARFKLPARVKEARLEAYVVYVHYLALLVLEATPHVVRRSIPTTAAEVRTEILARYGSINFETTLRYVWSLGIPVLTLNDPGAFHGACWRVDSRNVIVLKQRTNSAARWLHDLLHELWHAANDSDLEEHPAIEESEMSPTRRNSPQEQAAGEFAGDVVFAGRSQQLAEMCVAAANGSVERLKAAVPRIAEQEGVPVDALANYLAFRLSLQGINWWGATTNLQPGEAEMLCTPRDLLLQNIDLARVNEIDRDLLLRAVEPLVLAFSGKIGSGKSQVSKAVAAALGWTRASFGDYVRSVARSRGLEETRDVLQELGEQLVSKDVEGFCRGVLAHYDWHSGEPLVVDGLRHWAVAKALRKLVAPLDVRIVYCNVEESTRKARLEREGIPPDKVDQADKHSTEQEVTSVIPKMADLTLEGNRSPEEIVNKVVSWVHQGDGILQHCVQ